MPTIANGTTIRKIERSWDEMLDGPAPEATTDEQYQAYFEQCVAQAARGMDTPQYAARGKLTNAMDLVLAGKVEAHDNGNHTVTGSKPYIIHDTCPCHDGQHGKSKWCKHLVAVELYRRTHARLGTPASPPVAHASPAAENGVAASVERQAGIPTQFVVQIKGKDFVQYAGLLAMAHEQGLMSLSAQFITVDNELALAEARAVFEDGRSFSECADATPSNVGPKVKAHFARMALTRAKARALRDALNISMCAVEELEAA